MKNNASLVDSTIIDYYKEIEAELLKLNNLQKNIRKKLNRRVTNGDSFEKDEYDLTKHYFTYEDYESYSIEMLS